MELTKLFEVQRGLDAEIEKNHPVGFMENRFEKKLLATMVEIGEFANEVPESFKFWSVKKMSKQKALDEFVDIIHFLLSIGNDLGYNKIEVWVLPGFKKLDAAIMQLYAKVQNLYFLQTYDTEQGYDFEKIDQVDYEIILAAYLNISEILGFTWEEIESAYLRKNHVNHERQATGY